MSFQQTLLIIKPDGLAKGLVGTILNTIKLYDLLVVDHARVQIDSEWAEELYADKKQDAHFKETTAWISSNTVLFLKIQGDEAIEKVKKRIIGRYPEGLRGQYSEDRVKNVAHASDSEDAAKLELRLSASIFEEEASRNRVLFGGKTIFALTGMSECGKSTVGRYLDSQGIPRLKIVKLFELVRNAWSPSPNGELNQFTALEEKRDPYALWDAFVNELLSEMNSQGVSSVSIESLYGGGLGPFLKQRMRESFCLIYIDIPVEIRLQRQMQREGLGSIQEAEKLLLPRDEIKTKSGIPELKQVADEIVNNSGTLENLYGMMDDIIARHKKKV